MRVVIAGGHGKIALALERLLAERGDEVVGLVRNPDHADDLEKLGAEPAIFDLENNTAEELAQILEGADAVVFAAGAGPGSGIPRKRTVDYGGAVLLADAAERAGVRRYVMVSAIGVDRGSERIEDETFAAYVDAKREADADVMSRDLDWTVLRPGGLTDDPGTGLVTMGDDVGMGQVPREDVAAVIAAVLDEPESAGVVAELVSGDTSIVDAVEGLWA